LCLPYIKEEMATVPYCESTLGIARIYYAKGLKDSSLFYAKKSFAEAKRKNFAQYILNASLFLSDYYKNINSVDSSYKYLSEVIIAKDSLFGQEKVKQIQNLELQEILRQREIEKSRQEAETERNKNLQYGIINFSNYLHFIIFPFVVK